ncbi:RH56 [Hepatospora eriocheir]|uniref:RH56 n=1 Tax=Hepatospora eriocheir TaxID=1081669 RepID=A0A1X0QKF5_9MICR|nr:RH56 [Hepatospora eriocheir]
MSDSKKIEIIRNIVKHYNKQTIIFCERSETARLLDRKLDDLCVSIGEFSTSNEKLGIVKNFKKKQFKVLPTVDVLSRGIDIQNVEIVINYELPVNPETYLHRVGRAGRFESDGYAFSFINNQNDIIRLNDIVYRHEIDIKEYKP